MAKELRVAPGPAVKRGEPVTFRFNGRTVHAFDGETVGAALHASGENVLMRSIKYHRPRGLFCNTGACANCLLRIDGAPNQRACTTPLVKGMVIETQNAFPSARRDVFAVVDKVYRTKFDYHEKFIRPKFMVPVYNGVIRMMAGFGKVPDARRLAPPRPTITRIDVDVLVVGAGPAGLGAAVAAAEGAATVLLVEETRRPGGTLLLRRDMADGRDGKDVAAEWAARFQDAGGRLLTRAVAFGCYRTDGQGETLPAPGIVPVMTPDGIIEVHAKTLVVAAGYYETPPRFAGNDLPGIMGARAALILLHRHGVLAGRRIIGASSRPLAKQACADLVAAGAELIGIIGEGAWKDARIIEAQGTTRVHRAVIEVDGRRAEFAVDTILSAGDETPRIEILQQAGTEMVWTGTAYNVRVENADGSTSMPGVFAVGDLLGLADADTQLAAGSRAGEAAARVARGANA